MSDPNPYEPPRMVEPLTKARVVKRGIGVSLILLATPPAMVIAVAASCTTGELAIDVPASLVFSFPLIVLTILIGWAAILDRRKSDDSNRTHSRLGIFLSTPPLVAIAAAVGFGLAIPVFFVVGDGGSTWFHLTLILGTFWLPPTIALLAMLWLAWRAR